MVPGFSLEAKLFFCCWRLEKHREHITRWSQVGRSDGSFLCGFGFIGDPPRQKYWLTPLWNFAIVIQDAPVLITYPSVVQ